MPNPYLVSADPAAEHKIRQLLDGPLPGDPENDSAEVFFEHKGWWLRFYDVTEERHATFRVIDVAGLDPVTRLVGLGLERV